MEDIKEPEQIVVDRRPLWIVILDRMRREIALLAIFAIFVLLLNQDAPDDLSLEGYKVLCLFFLCVSLWATNLIPLSVTSLLAIAMVPLLGVMDASKAYAFFGNRAVFFILGVFILSAAMVACGLTARMSFWVLKRWGDSPTKLLSAIFLFGAVSSCFMSEHAVAAMLYPIVFEIVNALGLKGKKTRFGKALFFAMAWGCIIGGSATVFGGGRVPLAMEIMDKTAPGGASIGILQYTQLSWPLALLMLAGAWAILMFLYPPDVEDVQAAQRHLHEKSAALGTVSVREKGVGLVMLLTLFMWFGYSEVFGIANIAILAIVALFVLKLVDWKMVEKHVNWAIILMYGGAICLGEVMAESGAALWLAKKIFSGVIDAPLVFLMTVAFLSILFTTFMNNSAVIAILLPPALSLAPAYGIGPVLAAMTVILPSNFAFILPIATPASALAYSSRMISLRDMAFSGIILGVLGMVCYLFTLKVYWPLIGFK